MCISCCEFMYGTNVMFCCRLLAVLNACYCWKERIKHIRRVYWMLMDYYCVNCFFFFLSQLTLLCLDSLLFHNILFIIFVKIYLSLINKHSLFAMLSNDIFTWFYYVFFVVLFDGYYGHNKCWGSKINVMLFSHFSRFVRKSNIYVRSMKCHSADKLKTDIRKTLWCGTSTPSKQVTRTTNSEVTTRITSSELNTVDKLSVGHVAGWQNAPLTYGRRSGWVVCTSKGHSVDKLEHGSFRGCLCTDHLRCLARSLAVWPTQACVPSVHVQLSTFWHGVTDPPRELGQLLPQ